MCEEMSRTTRIIFDYVINTPDWQEIEAMITNSSGDYGWWPELDRLTIVHRTDAYEKVLYEDCLVDEGFDLNEVKQKAEELAKEFLSPEEN